MLNDAAEDSRRATGLILSRSSSRLHYGPLFSETFVIVKRYRKDGPVINLITNILSKPTPVVRFIITNVCCQGQGWR